MMKLKKEWGYNMIKKQYLAQLLLFLFCIINITAVVGWDPEPPAATYSEDDWGVYVQLIYGNLLDMPVYIPRDSSILPTPELTILMGGLERGGSRNVTIDTYSYNRSSSSYNILYSSRDYTLRQGDGGYTYIAYKKIVFDVTNSTMMIVFRYLDINIDFSYVPDPLYVNFQTTEFFVRLSVLWFLAIGIITALLAAVAGRKLQRRTIQVPPAPIITISIAPLRTLIY